MNDFLWSTMIYYQSFREHKKALRDDNVHIAGCVVALVAMLEGMYVLATAPNNATPQIAR